MNMMQQYVNERNKMKLKNANENWILKTTNWDELKERLQKENIDGDLSDEFLHIHWSLLRLAYSKHSGKNIVSWKPIKHSLCSDNIDVDKPKSYLHIRWNRLRSVLICYGVI